MPRKVSVYGLKPPENAAPLTFPQPPDPTGKRRADGLEGDVASDKHQRQRDGNDNNNNDNRAESESVAKVDEGDVQPNDDNVNNSNDDNDDDDDDDRPSFDPAVPHGYRPVDAGNEAAWSEWHQGQPQWHHYHHWWGPPQHPYYDDSQQQQHQQHGGQHSNNNSNSNAPNQHPAADGHHQYPAYHEFMPPLHKHDHKEGGPPPPHPYYYPPHPHHNPNHAAPYNPTQQPPSKRPRKETDDDDNDQQQQHRPTPHHIIPHHIPPPAPHHWQQPPPNMMHPNNHQNNPFMMHPNTQPPPPSTATTASTAIGHSYNPKHNPYNHIHPQQQQQHPYDTGNNIIKLPTYPYDDSFQSKSWDEMVDMLRKFNVEFPGEYDYERLRIDTHNNHSAGAGGGDNNDDEGNVGNVNNNNGDHNNNNEDNNDNIDNEFKQDLLRSSWIKELRWQRRARAPSDEKSPKATRGRDKTPAFPPLPDCLTLSPDRIRILNELHFNWCDDLSSWQKWLNDIMHYRSRAAALGVNKEEEANIPLKYEAYPSLGNFVNRQRTEYRKLLQGRNSSMTQSKIEDLNRVGFQWSVREGGHTSWDIRLMELREYKIQNGHCNVPKIWRPNPSLGYWVNEQRFQYRKLINNKPSYMNEIKIAHLNALGFIWTLRESKKPWEDWLRELQKYKSVHGHLDVPLKYDKNLGLGAFVNNQRSEYRKLKRGETSSMTEEKIRDLEALGFKWSVRDSRTPWNSRLKELKSYKERFGNLNVPRDWEENAGLSYWVEKQRQQYKLYGRAPCHLTKERVEVLNELGFDWTCAEEEDGMEEVEDAELEAEFETKQEAVEKEEVEPMDLKEAAVEI